MFQSPLGCIHEDHRDSDLKPEDISEVTVPIEGLVRYQDVARQIPATTWRPRQVCPMSLPSLATGLIRVGRIVTISRVIGVLRSPWIRARKSFAK